MLTLQLSHDHMGHVLAALGLFKLVNRWREGPLAFLPGKVVLPGHDQDDLERLVKGLLTCPISGGHSKNEATRFDVLDETVDWYVKPGFDENGPRTPKKKKKETPPTRKEPVRESPVWIAMWSGKQNPNQILLRNREALAQVPVGEELLVTRLPSQRKPKFGFDTDSIWSRLTLGFSPNTQGMIECIAPAVEILSFVGAQSFRPRRNKMTFTYSLWGNPLPLAVARGVFGNDTPLADMQYEARLFRRAKEYFGITRGEPVTTKNT